MAGTALSRALSALASPATRERFERWRSFRGIEDLEIEDALSHVEGVHHTLHSLERHFVEFIKNIQSRRRAPLGVVRFQEVCQRLVYSARRTTVPARTCLPKPGTLARPPASGFIRRTLSESGPSHEQNRQPLANLLEPDNAQGCAATALDVLDDSTKWRSRLWRVW